MAVWWLSFVEVNPVEGDSFLGACIVSGGDHVDAVKTAHEFKCNPGGEVAIALIPNDTVPFIDSRWLYRLLSKEECAELDEEIQQTCPYARTRAEEVTATH